MSRRPPTGAGWPCASAKTSPPAGLMSSPTLDLGCGRLSTGLQPRSSAHRTHRSPVRTHEVLAVEAVVVDAGAAKSKSFVQALRAHVIDLGAESDAAGAAPRQRRGGKPESTPSQSVPLQSGEDRDPVEMPPTRIVGDADIGDRLPVQHTKVESDTRRHDVGAKFNGAVPPDPRERCVIDL